MRLACFLLALSLLGVLCSEDDRVDNPVGRLNDELTGPERTYDHQAWRAVEPAAENANPEGWRNEDVQPDPPRRRRPGRKRKRRPHTPPPPEDSAGEQDGVRFSIDAGIQVTGEEVERPRQRRPARLQEDRHWRGEVNEDRPLRRRGHRRKQRPYLPNLGDGPSGQGFPIRLDTNVRVEPGEGVKIRVVEEMTGPSGDDNNREDNDQGENTDSTTVVYEENFKETVNNEESDKDTAQNDKSYRKPYSQAKRQEAEEMAMLGGSSDLKALLKQSGGLSLSEVLQQRNLSLADLLTGKQYALSALKPSAQPENENGFQPMSAKSGENPKEESREEKRRAELSKRLEPSDEGFDTEKQRRRLPPVNKSPQQQQRRPRPNEEKTAESTRERNDLIRRRLPGTNNYRRQKPQTPAKENIDVKDVVAEKEETPTEYPVKSLNENLIKTNSEDDNDNFTTEVHSSKNLIEEEFEIITTTQEIPTTTVKKQRKEEVQNRLSLKPRLRLPAVKTVPKRILNPTLRQTDDNKTQKSIVQQNQEGPQRATPKRAPIPNQAIPISVQDMFGLSEIVPSVKTISNSKENKTTTTERPKITANYKSMRRITTERTTTTSTTTSTTTTSTTVKPSVKISAKDEILEVLTDVKGGERLAKILAERNMTLKELVEHRERGSSQVHLADIFQNASIDPDLSEPFLAKSSIAPISKEFYPLKALLEGNMREPSGPSNKGAISGNPEPPPMFMDITKTSQNEENLGIVTLFDKFSEFVGNPKVFDPKEIKKDSDGSSYFTSVINVKPTDEIYRESRSESDFRNSHKQMSEIFSSIPTYLKTEEVVDAKVVQDWNIPNPFHQKTSVGVQVMPEKDVDGDGLIVLDDLQRIEQIDNHIAQASNQKIEENFINQNSYNDPEPNFYTRLPVGVRSAIIVSSAIVGTSLIVFLTIFVACRWRQKKRNLLRYEDSINAGIMRASIINSARKLSKNNCSSRSISPILTTGETLYRNQKLNKMDTQAQRDSHDYLWDSLRKPFQ